MLLDCWLLWVPARRRGGRQTKASVWSNDEEDDDEEEGSDDDDYEDVDHEDVDHEGIDANKDSNNIRTITMTWPACGSQRLVARTRFSSQRPGRQIPSQPRSSWCLESLSW